MDTPLASVFSKGRYVGAILHRGARWATRQLARKAPRTGLLSHLQREAAAALQLKRWPLHFLPRKKKKKKKKKKN